MTQQPTELKPQQKPIKMQKSRALLFLDTNRIIWYQEGFASILTLELPQDAIKHLEVINREEIYTAIKNTVTQNKLPAADALIILSSKLLFIQDITKDADVKKNQEALDKYLRIVPFEDVGYTSIESGKATRVIAGNLEYPEVVKDALTDSGFNVNVISPITILGDTYANVSTLDAKTAATLLGQSETFKKFPLSPVKKFVEETENKPGSIVLPDDDGEDGKPNKMRVYLLGGVFGLLLIVLGVMVYINILAPQSQPKPVRKRPVVVAAQPTPTLAIESPESTMSANLSNLQVQIQYQDDVEETEELQNDLEDLGLEEITTRSSGGVNAARTQVAFSEDVTQDAQDAILAEIRNAFPNAQVQPSSPTQFDVIIILGDN